MASAQDLRKRIKSVKNTQQITKAMKMVASARLRRAQSRVAGSAPYADALGQILRHIVGNLPENFTSPLLEVRPIKKTAFIVVGADKGLAGAFSSNITKFTMEAIHNLPHHNYHVITTGRKPQESLSSRGIEVSRGYAGFSDNPAYEHARTLIQNIIALYVRKDVDEVVIVYTHFVNSMTQTVMSKRLLPLETPEGEQASDYIFMPNAVTVLEELLPKYLEITVYNALLQSAASELGARMTAMTAATDNAGELIGTLDLEYNKLRQSSITNEISEIVGGANALQ